MLRQYLGWPLSPMGIDICLELRLGWIDKYLQGLGWGCLNDGFVELFSVN